MSNSQTSNAYDVIVVGGGAAGLSGALVLARSRRSVLGIDSFEPRNAPAAAMHNFLSRDGTSPLALLEVGRVEVRGYGGEVVEAHVRSAARQDDGFSVSLGDGRTLSARRLLIATGLVDQLPDVPGLHERWGVTWCTARTVTAGRSATRRWESSVLARWLCTRPCSFAN